MRSLFLILTFFISGIVSAQNPPNYPYRATRERVIAMMPDSTLHAPGGTTPSLRTGGGSRPGALFYRTTDSAGYDYTGNNWFRRAYARDTSTFLATKTDIEGAGQEFGTADTLFSAERYVNQDGNSFLWKNGKVKIRADLEPLGSRYTYNSATVVDQTPSATATIDGSGIRLQGGGNNLSNYVLLEDSIAAHNWTLSGSLVANNKNDSSLAICFAFDAMGNGQNFYVFFQLADTSGYINGNLSAALPTGAEVNNRGVYTLKWSAGDIFRYEISRTSYKGFIRLFNETTNSSTILDMPELQVAVSDLRIYTIGSGSDWKILNDLTLTYHDPVFPKWIFTGDSTDTGLTGDSEATTPYNIAFDGVNDGVIDLSAATTRSADGLFLLKDLGLFQGQYVFISWGVNDRNAGVSTATYGQNLRAIRDYVISLGKTPIFVNGTPQNSGSMIPYNDTMEVVAFETSSLYIDIYTALVGVGTAMDADYNWGDGIHLNQLGNNVKGNAIRAALITAGLLTFDSPFSIGTLPITYRHNSIVGYDKNGNLTRAYAGTDPGYIWNYETLSGTYRQRANINLAAGYGIWADYMAIGGAVQSSPYFSVNLSGQTNATSFSAGNSTNQFMYTPSSRYFYGPGGVQMLNGMSWLPSAQAFTITQSSPSTPNILFSANTTTGNNPNASYQLARLGFNNNYHLIVNRKGGTEMDSTAKYTADITSLILANPRNIPDVGTVNGLISDSLAAFTGGGGGGTVTSVATDDATGITGGTITTMGTLAIDTNLITTRLWHQKSVDSLGALIGSGGGANTALSNLASVAINASLLPGTTNSIALGDATHAWSDADFGDGAILRFNNSYTLTHSTGILTGSGSIYTNNKFKLNGATGGLQIGARNNPTGTAWEIYSATGELSFFGNGSDRLTLTNGGLLGIGATSPTARLELAAGSTTANTAPLEFNSGATETTIRAGLVQYNGQFYLSNSALNQLGFGGVLANSSTAVSNNSTSATTLVTYTTKANTFNATNEMASGVIDGTFGDATGTETLTLTFAGTTIFTNAGLAGNDRSWTMNFRIVRTGASTASAYVEFFSPLETLKTTTDVTSLTFSGTNAIVLTGTSSQSTVDAIVMKNYRINYMPAANN